MTDDDYDALSQKQLASIKRDMRISLEDAAVRATYKVMAELAQPEQEPVATLDDLEQEIYENTRQFVSRDVMEWMLKRYYTTPPQRTWVGLTDEEIKQGESKEELGHGFIQGALWAEATLKEKNT
jgi:hypothetical protein